MKSATKPNVRPNLGLTIDWDFFMDHTPSDARDCTHFDAAVWAARPFEQQLINYQEFWNLLEQHAGVCLPSTGLVVNRHVEALTYFLGCDLLINIDKHLDTGTPLKPYLYSSADWVRGFPGEVIQCNVWSPKSFVTFLEELQLAENFSQVDRLLIARSDPWTSPEHDQAFQDFLALCPCELYILDMADRLRELPRDADYFSSWLCADWDALVRNSRIFMPFQSSGVDLT